MDLPIGQRCGEAGGDVMSANKHGPANREAMLMHLVFDCFIFQLPSAS